MSDHYDENLTHVAEPAAPTDRKAAVSATLGDYAALWFAEQLREYAEYGDHTEDHYAGIALAYVRYIDRKVRDQGNRHVTIYGHTEDAAETLMDAVFYILDTSDPINVEATVDTAIRDIYTEYIEEEN